jgi:hypothetical protein
MPRRGYVRTGTVITMDYERGTVRKNHPDSVKLREEIHWYRHLPTELGDLVPVVVDDEIDAHGYEMSLIPGPTLADLWVFGPHDWGFWKTVLGALGDTLDRLHRYTRDDQHDPAGAQQDMYVEKTLERIRLLSELRGCPLPETLWTGPLLDGNRLPGLDTVTRTLRDTYRRSGLAQPREQAIVHGDFHFGNLFYRTGTSPVTLIDPRGSFAGNPGTFGDPVYDDLKLGHSIIGRYDHVSAGSVHVTVDGDRFSTADPGDCGDTTPERDAASWLVDRIGDRYGLAADDLHLGVSVLLLSLAALHDDPDRQNGYLLRGLELYGDVVC